MIFAEGLGRTFGSYVAVENINVDIKQGEIFGILGPNGAGKTTTLRLLTGLVAPSSGRAEVAGINVIQDPDLVRQKVGILTETPGIYARLDALENLRFYASVYGVENADQKIRNYLERFDLWERRKEPVGSFSKGMRQKLAIARAVLHDPQVVFLDEPTSALDPESSRIVHELIVELRQRGATVVLCTHHLDEAEKLCDRIGVLRKTLLHVDTPQALRRKLYGHLIEVDTRSELSDETVARITSIEGVKLLASRGTHIELSVAHVEESVPQIIATLVGDGAAVLRVAEKARSLEDVYFELLRTGGA